MKKEFERLPRNVVPNFYHLDITPSFETFKFDGKVQIDVNVNSETNVIVMNTHQLEIKSAKVGDKVGSSSLDLENQLLTITFPTNLSVGDHKVEIEYSGTLNDELAGFYRTKEVNSEGEINWALVTQFEACDARRALPCWDEPDRKAKFQVKLTIPKDKTALSNTELLGIEDLGNGKMTCSFAETPIMSTYLLAFCVGDYDYLEDSTKGIKVRVYTPKNQSHLGKFSLHCAVKSLEFFIDYFNIDYPLPKLDMVAVPDFAAGAMENWGLVTYRSTKILSEENASFEQKKSNARTIAHEIAHQWFGNLVTMEWWTHLWLNEGFARFCEHIACDAIFPEWHVWDHFLPDVFELALDLDSMNSSHPIEIPVGHPSEVDEIFDAISYAKGGSVIRMLQLWIGENNFRNGLSNYLKKFSYKNALTEDLWDELEKESKLPVRDVMSGWTSKMGFPLVDVQVESWDSKSLKVKLTQSKFPADSDSIWRIPISYMTSSDSSHKKFIMSEKTTELTIENVPLDGWIKLNADGVGFYRVKYDEKIFSNLVRDVSKMDVRNRFTIQSDIQAMTKYGLKNAVEYLRLLDAYKNETDYIVLSDISSGWATFNKFKKKLNIESKLNQFTIDLFSSALNHIGYDMNSSSTVTDQMLRGRLIDIMGSSQHGPTIDFCNEKFKSMSESLSAVPADLRTPITKVAATTLDNLEPLVALHTKAVTAIDKAIVERSLYKVPADLLAKAFGILIADNMRPANAIFGILAFKSREEGRQLLWNMIKLSDEWFVKLPGNLKGALIKHTIGSIDDRQQLNEVEEFFAKNPSDKARALSQGLEQANSNISWLERNGEEVQLFFK